MATMKSEKFCDWDWPDRTKAMRAPEWKEAGNDWRPHLHFVGSFTSREEAIRSTCVLKMVESFDRYIAAYWFYSPLDRCWSLELQLKPKHVKQKARIRREYDEQVPLAVRFLTLRESLPVMVM